MRQALNHHVSTTQRAAAKHRERFIPVLYQRWLDLSFLHFAFAPSVVEPLIPNGVELDTFPDAWGEQRAWVGLIAFRISATRPRFGLPLPYWSSFAELNVRTYVRKSGFDPAVLFLTLDATPWLTCAVARAIFKVPYLRAHTTCQAKGGRIWYRSERQGDPVADTAILARPESNLRLAEPGTLDHFLLERYRYFAQYGGRLFTAAVAHAPYRLSGLQVEEFRSSHLAALGLPASDLVRACYSPAVHSAFSLLQTVPSGRSE